jgi:hypothetical protein
MTLQEQQQQRAFLITIMLNQENDLGLDIISLCTIDRRCYCGWERSCLGRSCMATTFLFDRSFSLIALDWDMAD